MVRLMARAETKNDPWRSRITGHGEEDPTQLLANPANWRTHPNRQRDALRGALDTVGWVATVLVNTTTGHLVDGHARVEEAITRGEPSVPVTYVELTPEEEAVVLATLDPIGAMATTDMARLGELLADISVDNRGLAYLLEKLKPPSGDAYTATIATPVYEITGEKPPVSALMNETKALALRAEILAAELEPDERDFLLAAAGRHVVFDYGQIAEWYAHARPEVQRLMEASALVIIDYESAIRNGYVRFMEAMVELEDQDHDA